MSVFKNKILFKLIASICLFLTLLNFGFQNRVYADDDVWGGILITPMTKLLTALVDGIITILHRSVMDQQVCIVTISGKADWWESWGEIVVAIIATVAIITVTVLTAGTATAIAALAIGGIATYAAYELGFEVEGHLLSLGGTWIAERLGNALFERDIFIPIFTITPEEIFGNKIALFDINFFNPGKYVEGTEMQPEVREEYQEITCQAAAENMEYYIHNIADFVKEAYIQTPIGGGNNPLSNPAEPKADPDEKDMRRTRGVNSFLTEVEYGEKFVEFLKNQRYWKEEYRGSDYKIELHYTRTHNQKDLLEILNQNVPLPTMSKEELQCTIKKVSTDEVALKVEFIYDVEFVPGDETMPVKPATQENTIKLSGIRSNTYSVEVEVLRMSTAAELKGTVSKWYFILRNLALLVLMLILIYTGIRIVIGSTAGQKAKYKERLLDWLVAVCLIFVMHYIMAFSMAIVEKITNLINDINGADGCYEIIELSDVQLKRIKEDTEESSNEESAFAAAFRENGTLDETTFATPHLHWKTNLLGAIKIKSQQVNEGTAKWVGYSLCYMVLVLQTLFFSWTYLKRVLYMAFLTMIAPLVAMTYPIDKITDGKAQAFNAWLKEYIFNLLIQPVHLLLYLILVGSAYALAATNVIYSIVAIGFIMSAEKLVRKFFGFSKAQTPGALGGAAGAALGFAGLQKVMNFGKKREKSKKEDKEDKNKIKFQGKNKIDPMKAMSKESESKKTPNKKSEEKDGEEGGSSPKLSNQEGKTDTEGSKGKADGASKLSNSESGGLKPLTKIETPKLSRDWENGKDDKKKSKKDRKVLRTAKSMGKAYTRMLGKKAKERLKKARPIRALARGATGLLGGTALGMAGLALGIAGGDASKAFQYTTAGAIGGYQAGKGIAGAVVDTFTVDNKKLKEDMQLEWYGSDYKNVMHEKDKKEFLEDEENIDYIRKTTGASREDAQQILSSTGEQCLDVGISDIADIATIYEMQKKGISIDKAMAAQQFSAYLPSDLNKMGEDDRNSFISKWQRMYEEGGYDNPEYLAAQSMEMAELFGKTKSGLKKA